MRVGFHMAKRHYSQASLDCSRDELISVIPLTQLAAELLAEHGLSGLGEHDPLRLRLTCPAMLPAATLHIACLSLTTR